MARIYDNLADTFGNTPLVKIPRLNKDLPGTVLVKMESFNPAGSVKDRIGVAMIEAAERDGRLLPGMTILEPTSGNTGIALAFVAAAKGYPLILVMPDTMTIERRNLLKAYGAQVVLTPGAEGMPGALRRAERDHARAPDNEYFMPQQFENPANPGDPSPHDRRGNLARHRRHGRRRRRRDRHRRHDYRRRRGAQRAQAGTCASSPSSRMLRRCSPAESPARTRFKAPAPDSCRRFSTPQVYDEVIRVTDADAIATARRLAREEGMLVGISAGANVWAALQVAARPESKGKTIVTIGCDTGERYLSNPVFAEQEAIVVEPALV